MLVSTGCLGYRSTLVRIYNVWKVRNKKLNDGWIRIRGRLRCDDIMDEGTVWGYIETQYTCINLDLLCRVANNCESALLYPRIDLGSLDFNARNIPSITVWVSCYPGLMSWIGTHQRYDWYILLCKCIFPPILILLLHRTRQWYRYTWHIWIPNSSKSLQQMLGRGAYPQNISGIWFSGVGDQRKKGILRSRHVTPLAGASGIWSPPIDSILVGKIWDDPDDLYSRSQWSRLH